MTARAEGPGGADQAPDQVTEQAPARPGRVTELALVAAGLAVVVYLLGFVDDGALGSSLIAPLLLGGGLLAGTAALSTVGPRVLAGAAVATLTGALLLLQADLGGADSPVAIGALVLALLEAGAAVGAVLVHAGVLRTRPARPRKEKKTAASEPQLPPYPAQQYPGQPYPAAPYAPGPYAGYPGEPYPGDQYAGDQARPGLPYGVPGYPPPPSYGTAAGLDPAAQGYAPGAHAAPTPASGLPGGMMPNGAVPHVVPNVGAGEQPTAVSAPEAYRSGVPASAGGSGAVPVSPVYGSGAFRPAGAHAEPRPEVPAAPTATGSHAAPDPAAGEPVSRHGRGEVNLFGAPEHRRNGARPDGDDDRTRAIPAVTDEP